MIGFELAEKLTSLPASAILRVFQTLPNAFLRISARGNIEQPLIGLGVLHNDRGVPIHGQHQWTLGLP